MPAGEVTVKLNLNKDGYSAGMTAARREAQQTAQAIGDMGHKTVTQMQAASASIRLIEGDMTRNVRAVERFITTIPGIGAALKAAFPLVGAAATLGIIARIGEEAYKSIQQVRGLNTAIQAGFDHVTSSGMLANDQLALTNSKLQDEINKLEHKPGDGLATALAEAKVKADQLYDSLRQDNEEIAKVLEGNQSGILAQLMGKAPSGEVKQDIQRIMTDIQTTARKARDGDPTTRARENAHMEEQLRAGVSRIEQLKLQNPNGVTNGVDFSGNFNALDATEAVLKQRYDRLQLDKENQALQQKKAGDDQAKQIAEDAKKAHAAYRAAQEAIVEQWRKNLDQDKGNAEISIDQEAAYWMYRAETAKKGSLRYRAALDEAYRDIARINADTMRLRKEGASKSDAFDATANNLGIDRFDLSRGDSGEMKSQGNEAINYLKTLNESIELHKANAAAIAEAGIQMGLMTGQVSALDAAQMRGALHEQEYRDAIDGVTQALANAEALPEGFEKSQRIADLNKQRGSIETKHTIQGGQDQQAIDSQQLGSASRQALGTMVNSWENMTQGIVQTMTRAMDGFNDEIVNAMMGKKTNFGRVFSEAGAGLSKTALQSAEGHVMGAFGLGKPDGSKGNPIYTLDAGTSGSLGSLPSSPFFRPFAGGQQGGKQGGQSGGGGSIFSQLFHSFFGGGGGGDNYQTDSDGMPMGFQGGFASGGDVLANRPAMVGEHGPEMFLPRTNGRVVPNHQLGGGDSHVYHIDARGSNDPMAVHAAVARALPHAVAASVQANHQAKVRSPGGR